MASDSKIDSNDLDYTNIRSDRDPGGENSTYESLEEDVKHMIDTHKSKQASVSQKALTPVDNERSISTPSTIKRAMSASSDTTPVASALSEGTLLLPSRRVYLNVAGTKEENKRLKAEIFDLKSQLFVLKKDLPELVNHEGKNLTEEYIRICAELSNEKARSAEMEQTCLSQKKNFDEERTKFISEKSDWEAKCESLLLEKNELEKELKELRRQLFEREDGSESQGDGSVGKISLISEMGMEVEKLRSVISQQSVDQEKVRKEMEAEIDRLQVELQHVKEDLAKQSVYFNEEKMHCESLKVEMAKLQRFADDTAQEVEYQKQVSEKQLAKVLAENEIALDKRDRTIRILLKKLKSNEVKMPVSTEKCEGSNSYSEHDNILDLNPFAQGILDRINEFAIENEAIRKRVIELGVHDVELTSEVGQSEAPSTEDENWNIKRCERENEELADFLAQNRTIPDGSVDEELGGKLALFDAVNNDAPEKDYLKEQFEDSMRSVGASEMLNITMAADLLSRSVVLTEDLGGVKNKLSVFQSVCTRLFEKLRGTANFLQTLLDELGAGDQGRELMAQIEALRIDLDQSIATAIDISREVEAAEESIEDLSAHLQRSLNCSVGRTSISSNENQQNVSALLRVHTAYKHLNAELANEKLRTNEVMQLNKQLQAHITHMEETKQKITGELDELKRNMIVKENETTLSLKAAEQRYQLKSQQFDELYEQAQAWKQMIETKESHAVEKETQMQREIDQMGEKCRELEICLAEANHALKLKDESIKKLRVDIECFNAELTTRNSELVHYTIRITDLNRKMYEIFGAMRESLGIVCEEVDKPIVEVTVDAGVDILAQLNQFEVVLEEFAKINHYVTDMKHKMTKLQQNLDLCERNYNVISTKCRGLIDENARFEAECNGWKQRLLDFQQQMQAEQQSYKTQERDLQDLKTKNCYLRENNERLTKALIDTETKYDELIARQNRVSFSDGIHSERYAVATGTMTSLSALDFIEMADKLKAFTSFTKRMYMLAAKWNFEATKDPDYIIAQKSVDLDYLYHIFVRILSGTDAVLHGLGNQVAANNVRLDSVEIERNQKCQPGASTKSSDEFSSVDVQAAVDTVDQIIQILKADSNKPQEMDVAELLAKMRSLRAQISSFYWQSQQFEKIKENVAPSEALEAENKRLQVALTDAKSLLQKAHERLNKLPNSKQMCEQILHEMNKISEVMKASSRDVHRLGSRSHGSVRGKDKK